MVELLAPAGSREALIAAIESGANAVYLAGNSFGARAYANNFDDDGLKEAVKLAHLRNVLINVTVNTIIDDQEIPALEKYLQFLYDVGVDAVLVQDLGVAKIAHEIVPQLPLHASTQMTVHNLDGVLALEKLGFTRVVLSRELSLEAIRHICRNSKAEIEVFVHGALCVCYSGQCLMSSIIGGRSGNRGRCAQPCRLPYTLVDEQDKDLLRDSAGKYLLSPRDLNTIDLLPQLIEAGVSSLKIEGRMKRPEYVAIVVNTYRQAIDSYFAGAFNVSDDSRKNLAQIFNRDFTTAYMEKKQGRNMMSDKRPNNRGLMLGRVLYYDRESKRAVLKLSDTLSEGDQVDFWVKVGGRVAATVKDMRLVPSNTIPQGKTNSKKNGMFAAKGSGAYAINKSNDSKSHGDSKNNRQKNNNEQQNFLKAVAYGQSVIKAESGMIVSFPVDSMVFEHDRVFKVLDNKLMEWAKGFYNTGAPVRRIPLDVRVTVSIGSPLKIYLQDVAGNKAQAATEFIGELAQKRPLTKETIEKQIKRLGTSVFSLRDLNIEIDGLVMVPVSEINEARRRVVDELEQKRLEQAYHYWEQTGNKYSMIVEQLRLVNSLVRQSDNAAKAQSGEAVNHKKRNRKLANEVQLSVTVDSLEKLSAAIAAGADWLVFGGDSYSHEYITLQQYNQAALLAHKAGRRIAFNTQRIIRDNELNTFHSWLEQVNDPDVASLNGDTEKAVLCRPDAINVHNIASLDMAQNMTDIPVQTDFSLIAYNKSTLNYLAARGVSAAVLSPELNMSQVEVLSQEFQAGMELACMVEGNLELMVSEYCCTGSFLGGLDTGKCSAPCVNSGKRLFLKDRKDISFPLVMDQSCHMHLLNGNRLSMLPHAMKFGLMGISRLCIDGRYMTADQLKRTIVNYRRFMIMSENLSDEQRELAERLEGANITRGHYFRGVL